MTIRTILSAILALSSVSPLFVVCTDAHAIPQSTNATTKAPYTAVTTQAETLVRSGPSVESAYPFGKLPQGSVVFVSEENLGWARISLSGETFTGWFGYVPASAAAVASEDGKTLSITGRSEVRAPNFEARGDPEKSFKMIAPLMDGDTLEILEIVKGERGSFYAVRLPSKATGWVNASSLRPATSAESVTSTPVAPSPRPIATPTATAPANTTDTTIADESGPRPLDEVPTSIVPELPEAITLTPTPTTTPTTTAPPIAPLDPAIARNIAAAKARAATYEDLEKIWGKLRKAPVETAELTQLRDRYLAFAEDTATTPIRANLAQTRAAQIALRIEVQDSILELAQLKAKSNASVDGIANLELALLNRKGYDAVGRLNASLVYDGERLPLLYRLMDNVTGQTIAYIVPGSSFDLSSMLGLMIGIKGPMTYDNALRLNTLSPSAIDVLSGTQTPATGPTPMTPAMTATGESTPSASDSDTGK